MYDNQLALSCSRVWYRCRCLDIDPGEDLRPTEGAHREVHHTPRACAEMTAGQEDHAALKTKRF